MILNHEVIGEGGRVALVAHGILGSAQNWRGTVKRWSEALPEWQFVSVDLRHHGDSRGAEGPDTLVSCARDLAEVASHLGLQPEAVIGHSFGGKVAMVYGREVGAESSLLRQIWVLDAMPGRVEASTARLHSDVIQVIDALKEIAVPLERRSNVVEALMERGFSRMLGQWMTTNLERSDTGYVWSFDLDGIERLIADYIREDLWPWLAEVREPLHVHVVAASESTRWTEEVRGRFVDLNPVALHDLEGGHWVHVDNPDGLMALVVAHLAA